MTLQKLAPNLIATLVSWLTVGLAVAVAEPGGFAHDAMILIAVFTTAVMWMGWAAGINNSRSAGTSEKAKRRAGTDDNVALLLEMLSEDERREIKERLLDQIQSDGELSSLAELVGDRDAQRQRRL